MKKMKAGCLLLIIMAVMLGCAVSVCAKSEVTYIFEEAVENNDIHYSFDNGILTVSGRGCVDDGYDSVCKKEEIKEVVINDGVTAIANYVFMGCTKLEKVSIPQTVSGIGYGVFRESNLREITIPSSVKSLGSYCLAFCKNLKKVTMPGDYVHYFEDGKDELIMSNVDTINLNSGFSEKNICDFRASKIYTDSKDKKYKSFGGVIYTKNGKRLVMVPASTKKLVIRKGCTTVSMWAMSYSNDMEAEYEPVCKNLKSVTIPKTVKYIADDSDIEYPNYSVLGKCNWKVLSKKINGKNLANLFKMMNKKNIKKILNSSDYKIKKIKNMYITKDQVLVYYDGKAKTVTIPKNVRVIADEVFMDNKYLRKVILSKNLREIGKEAFCYCFNLKKIEWGKKLRRVGKSAFDFTGLKNVKLPASVKKKGEHVFGEGL